MTVDREDTRERDAAAFFATWEQAWPATRLAKLFASEREWPALRARLAVLFELGEACWMLRDATVRAHKLAWWQDELRGHAQGHSRHPVLLAAPAAPFRVEAVDALQKNALIESAPDDAAIAFAILPTLAATDDSPEAIADRSILAAMGLMALREGHPAALALAPLDLRARHAVATADDAGRAALVAALAQAFAERLQDAQRRVKRADWHGARGLRVMQRTALDTVMALADGRDIPAQDWRSAWSAWWAVVGLR